MKKKETRSRALKRGAYGLLSDSARHLHFPMCSHFIKKKENKMDSYDNFVLLSVRRIEIGSYYMTCIIADSVV